MNRLAGWQPKRVTVLCCAFGAVLAGLFIAYLGVKQQPYWLVFLPIFVLMVLKKRLSALVSISLMCLLLGIWRGNMVMGKLSHYNQFYGKQVTLSGVTADDTSFNEARNQTEFHFKNIKNGSQALPGRIEVSTPGRVNITRGSRLLVSGKLSPSFGTTRQGSIRFARIEILQNNNSLTESIRSRFFASVHNSLSEPQASLGLGYLVGLRAEIPKQLSDQLAVVGLTHIVAVSGYNLTIIVKAIRRLFSKRSAYQSVLFAALLIAGFLVIAGDSAPINRAAVVCGFSLAAWYYGRTFHPLLLLLLSGAITAFVNPLYVWGDPGWYLSFLAFGGVLLLAPLVSEKLFGVKQPNVVLQILLETLCAQLFTLPYVLLLFGGVSLVAPLANVLVLPFIPIIMLMVFIVGLVGMVMPGLAYTLGSIPSALLTLQIWIVEKLSIVPRAHIDVKLSAAVILLLAVSIIWLTVYVWSSSKQRRKVKVLTIDYDLI